MTTKFSIGDVFTSGYSGELYLVENISENEWFEPRYEIRVLSKNITDSFLVSTIDNDVHFYGAA